MIRFSSTTIRLILVSLLLGLIACQSPGTQEGSVQIYPEMLDTLQAALMDYRQIAPITQTVEAFSMEAAYAVQARLAEKMENTRGPVCGYKVAYASQAAQAQFGMDEPARGPFYLIQREPSGSVLPMSAFTEIMLETEIAFVVGQTIDRPVESVDAVKQRVKSVHAAFDAGNFPYRIDEVKPTPQDMIAIGTGANIFIIGPAVDPSAVTLKDLTLGLSRNGERIRVSSADKVMGDPWNSMLWCANHLVNDGLTLEPGMVVLCGTAAPAYKVTGEEIKGEYIGDCGALGSVTMVIE